MYRKEITAQAVVCFRNATRYDAEVLVRGHGQFFIKQCATKEEAEQVANEEAKRLADKLTVAFEYWRDDGHFKKAQE